MPLLELLSSSQGVVSVELRPPRAELDRSAGMDAWIDTYHSVTGLVRDNMPVFLTDSAVGAREEHNLRHLVINLGSDVPRDRVVPFLTSKHTMDFCLNYAERAWHEGFSSLVVLGVVQAEVHGVLRRSITAARMRRPSRPCGSFYRCRSRDC